MVKFTMMMPSDNFADQTSFACSSPLLTWALVMITFDNTKCGEICGICPPLYPHTKTQKCRAPTYIHNTFAHTEFSYEYSSTRVHATPLARGRISPRSPGKHRSHSPLDRDRLGGGFDQLKNAFRPSAARSPWVEARGMTTMLFLTTKLRSTAFKRRILEKAPMTLFLDSIVIINNVKGKKKERER